MRSGGAPAGWPAAARGKDLNPRPGPRQFRRVEVSVTAARFLRMPANVLLDVLTVWRLEGRQHLPIDGPCIIVTNHLSFLDALLVFALVGGDKLTAWDAEKWDNNL